MTNGKGSKRKGLAANYVDEIYGGEPTSSSKEPPSPAEGAVEDVPAELSPGEAQPVEEVVRTPRRPVAAKQGRRAPARQGSQKVRATFHLSQELFDEVRDAVVALSGPPLRLTLAAFAESALKAELKRLEKAENDGKPFPERSGELKGGRPIGS